MKVPANITADSLMLEYLARVAAAGTRYLPKSDRMALLGKTRRRIERECGTGLADPECMRDVLARLGEPEELVMAERARIDAARIRRKARDIPAAPGEPLEGKVLPPAPRAGRAEPGGLADSGRLAQAATPPPGWTAAPVPVPSRPVARRGTVATALATAGYAASQLASTGVAAARRYPLEATAVILLGVGGLILPFPFWLLGATVAIWSRIWDPFDKWTAFLGPLVFALLGSIATASVIHATGNVVLIYSHAVRVDIGYLLRAGSVLCAVFLATRVRHGPRERVPPWRR